MNSSLAQAPDNSKGVPQSNLQNPPLHQAIQNNNLKGVKALLNQGVNLREYDFRLHPPLWCAVEQGNIQIVDALLKAKGIDPNQEILSSKKTGEVLNTPLMLAVTRGDAAIVQLLISNGANPEKKSASGLTPMKNAQNRKSQAVLKAFDKQPFAVAMPKKQMDTLFQLLKDTKKSEVSDVWNELKKLEQSGKDLGMLLNTYDAYGQLPLEYALWHDLKTAQHKVDEEQEFLCAYSLILYGADPNLLNRCGESLLYRTIKDTKNIKAIIFLLQKGAQPTKHNENDGNTPFHIAVLLKSPDIINKLAQHVKAGDTVDSPNFANTRPSGHVRKEKDEDKITLKALLDAAGRTFDTTHSLSNIDEEEYQETSELGKEVTTYRPRF